MDMNDLNKVSTNFLGIAQIGDSSKNVINEFVAQAARLKSINPTKLLAHPETIEKLALSIGAKVRDLIHPDRLMERDCVIEYKPTSLSLKIPTEFKTPIPNREIFDNRLDQIRINMAQSVNISPDYLYGSPTSRNVIAYKKNKNTLTLKKFKKLYKRKLS